MISRFAVRYLFCSFMILSPLSAQENEDKEPSFELKNLQIEVIPLSQKYNTFKVEARFDNEIDQDKIFFHWFRDNQPFKYYETDHLKLRDVESTEIKLTVSNLSGDIIASAKKTIHPTKNKLNPVSFKVLSSRGKIPLNSRLKITSDLNLLEDYYFETYNHKKIFKPSFDLIQTEPGSSKIRLVATNKHGITFKSDFVELQAKDLDLPTESFQYFSFDYNNQSTIPIVVNGEETLSYFQTEEQNLLMKLSEKVRRTILQPFIPNYIFSNGLRLKHISYLTEKSNCPLEATYELAEYKGFKDITVEIENCVIPKYQKYKFNKYFKSDNRIYSKGKSKSYTKIGPHIFIENEIQDYLYYDKDNNQIKIDKEKIEESFRDSVEKVNKYGFIFDVFDTRLLQRNRLFLLKNQIYNIKETSLKTHPSLPLKDHALYSDLRKAEKSYPERIYYQYPDKTSPIVGIKYHSSIANKNDKIRDVGESTIEHQRDPGQFKLIIDDFVDFDLYRIRDSGQVGFRVKKTNTQEGRFKIKKGIKLSKISSTNYDFLIYDGKTLGIRANEEMHVDDIIFKNNEYMSFSNLEKLKTGLKEKLNIEGKAISEHIDFNFNRFKRIHGKKVYHHNGMSFCGAIIKPLEINPFLSLKKDDYFCLYPKTLLGSLDKNSKFDFNKVIIKDSTSVPYKAIFDRLGLKGSDVLFSEQRKPRTLYRFVSAFNSNTSTRYLPFDELYIKLAKQYSIFGRKIPPNSVLIFDTMIGRAIGYKTPVDIRIEKNVFEKGTRLEFDKKGSFFRALYDDNIVYQRNFDIGESLQYLTGKEFYLCSRNGDKVIPAIDSEKKVDIQSCKNFGTGFRGMREYGFSINGSYLDKFKINRVEGNQVVLDRVVHIRAGEKHNHRIKAIRSEKVKFRVKISEFSTPTTLLTDQSEYWLPYVSGGRHYKFISKHTPLDGFYEDYCDSRTKKEVNLGWHEIKGSLIGIISYMTGKEDLCST